MMTMMMATVAVGGGFPKLQSHSYKDVCSIDKIREFLLCRKLKNCTGDRNMLYCTYMDSKHRLVKPHFEPNQSGLIKLEMLTYSLFQVELQGSLLHKIHGVLKMDLLSGGFKNRAFIIRCLLHKLFPSHIHVPSTVRFED